ncbi:MAG TPA: HAD-IA family hydrolase [Bacillota bacterium]|nr:HAD-IA family hydrolase [Bacillota bacterium]
MSRVCSQAGGETEGKPAVRAVLFDLDGTLFNTIPLILASHRHTFGKILGWTPQDEDILATIGEPLVTTFERYGGAKSRQMLREYIDWSVPRTLSHVGLFLGVVPMLEALRERGFKTGIVTSRRGEGMSVCLDAFDMTRLFDVLVSVDDTLEHKPKPAPLFCAMGRLGIRNPRHILYVGDAIHDLECAKNAGALFAAVSWTVMDKEVIRKGGPDFWIDDALDLPHLIRLVYDS